MAVNCLTCYRIHKCGDNKYFCPFLGINPCIRGEHYVKYVPKPKSSLSPSPEQTRIPKYIPVQRRRGSHGAGVNIDWAKYHNEIFTRLDKDEPLATIAKDLGLQPGSVQYYVSRYR